MTPRRLARARTHAAALQRATVAVIAIVLSACASLPGGGTGSTGGLATAPGSVQLTVFAAASLRDALTAITTAYAEVRPDVRLRVATDSSAMLRTQIEQGAPADVFLAADTVQPQALVDGGLADRAVPFATNTLVVVTPREDPARIGSPADLARPGVRVIAAGPGVPISRYATEAVERLAALPGYPPDFAQAYTRNVVSEEDNVAAIAAKVALGEADAAIVYRTDARDRPDLRAIDLPAEANVTATYAGVVVRASAHAREATDLLDWLVSPAGQTALADVGFGPAD